MDHLNEFDEMNEIMEEEYVDLDGLIGTTMHLVLDDDAEMDAIIIAAFTLDEYEWDYIALLPLDEEIDEEETDVMLYRLLVAEDGTPTLGAMESDDEYEAAAEAFYAEMERLEKEEEEE